MPKNRPLTQREIRQQRKEKDSESYVMIHNTSKQSIPIQLRAPTGVDFYVGEQTIPLYPGKSGKFPKSRLIDNQLINLQKAGRIKVENVK